MNQAAYLAAITKALRDRVLPGVGDGESRSVLEASIRALAGVADAIGEGRGDDGSPAPVLPPENPAVRAGTATTIAEDAARIAGEGWTGDAAQVAAVRREQALMREAVEAMAAMEKTAPKAADAGDGEDPLLIRPEAIERYFRERLGKPVTVTNYKQAAGGRSRQTVLFTLEGDTGLPAEMVLQRDHPAGISPQGVCDEYPVIELLADTPMLSAPPVLLESSKEPLGGAFMVLARLSGTLAGPDYFAPPRDPGLAEQLGEQLGHLHAVDPAPVEAGLGRTLPEGEDWAAELARLEATWEAQKHWPSVSASAAFAWMREHVGEIGPERAIIHNDASFHNILAQDGRITAILDWELVHIGHPAEDLGYCRPFVQETGGWDRFLAAYERVSGKRYPRAVIDYFSLRGLIHLMTLMQAGGRRMFETGVTDDINLVEVGASFMPKVMLRFANVLADVIAAD